MSTPDQQQIRQLVETWHSATRVGDLDTLLGLMTDDVVFLVPGRTPMNRAEFEALSRVPAGAARPVFEGRYEIQEIVVAGDLATLWTRLVVRVTPPGTGEPVERAGHTQSVLRKINGNWRIARDANLLSVVQRQP